VSAAARGSAALNGYALSNRETARRLPFVSRAPRYPTRSYPFPVTECECELGALS
jgi:hypothetical protein